VKNVAFGIGAALIFGVVAISSGDEGRMPELDGAVTMAQLYSVEQQSVAREADNVNCQARLTAQVFRADIDKAVGVCGDLFRANTA
jgi:hypothetical protein